MGKLSTSKLQSSTVVSTMPTPCYFGGIEGGGSHSSMVILNEKGDIVGKSVGPDTNVWQLGTSEVCKRLDAMIRDAKKNASISEKTKFASLGMCLSGAEQESANKSMIDCMKENYPDSSESVIIQSDTNGSIATACEKGGVVLISGTGSNCQLLNPDGSIGRCGGWGHMMGDEGGAYWIAHRAIKYVFNHDDNLEAAPFDPSFIRKAMFTYFKISDRFGLLDSLYSKFNKTEFSGFCKVLAVEGKNDPLTKHVFADAGNILARHVIALLPKMNKDILHQEGGLRIVCVGSVWKSWNLLKEAFINRIRDDDQHRVLKDLTLVELTQSSAVGAALIGARNIKREVKLDYSTNYKILHQTSLQ